MAIHHAPDSIVSQTPVLHARPVALKDQVISLLPNLTDADLEAVWSASLSLAIDRDYAAGNLPTAATTGDADLEDVVFDSPLYRVTRIEMNDGSWRYTQHDKATGESTVMP